jgi:hypothetical protein
LHPRPDQLPRLAEPLHVAGVRRLLVMVPHAPALLPQALKAAPPSLADGGLSQLTRMVPQREQPVRALRLAERVVELAWRLPHAAPATRVLPPELLWQATHAPDGGALLGAWLAGELLPQARLPARRW